jgi:hypothetical protein
MSAAKVKMSQFQLYDETLQMSFDLLDHLREIAAKDGYQLFDGNNAPALFISEVLRLREPFAHFEGRAASQAEVLKALDKSKIYGTDPHRGKTPESRDVGDNESDDDDDDDADIVVIQGSSGAAKSTSSSVQKTEENNSK